MIKRFQLPVFLFAVTAVSAQSKYTVEQAMQSDDMQVVANFIKFNPDHPVTPDLKSKLLLMVNNGAPIVRKTTTVSTTVTKTPAAGGAALVKRSGSETVKLLNHLFSNDPTKAEAYLLIRNNSKCKVTVMITGRELYTLSVPAEKENGILLSKGAYVLNADICGAQHASNKNIDGDMVVTYNGGK